MNTKKELEQGFNDPLKEDFRKFVWFIWKQMGLPDPTDIQYDISKYLQVGPKRSIIQAFRGVGKSWITCAFVVWLLYRDPDCKIMVVSASKVLADNFSTFVKRIIHEIPLLHHLRPKDNQRDSNVMFDVGAAKASKDPSVKSVGITGQLTGSRADVIVADDVEVPGNSMTQMQRDKLAELVKEFDAILKPLPTSRIIYLGTPQTEMSLYKALLERGYETRIWPARYPAPEKLGNYGVSLAPVVAQALAANPALAGKPTDPRRFDELDLQERETSYGRSGFLLQFMLDTTLSDLEKFPLKLSDLIVLPIDSSMGYGKVVWGPQPQKVLNDLPCMGLNNDRYYGPAMVSENEMMPYTGGVMFIDPSGRGKDETGYAVLKALNGQLFCPAAGGFSGGYEDETLRKLALIAFQHGVHTVVIESNFGDGMFLKLFQPVLLGIYKCKLEEVRNTKQKELRIIDTLEPVMMRHKLIIDPRVIRQDAETCGNDPKYSLFYQMTRITKDRGALAHDDRLDALAGAVAFFLEALAKDTDKAIQTHQDKLLKEELKKFCKQVVDKKKYPTKHKTWV